jgi:hypothetical protein
VEHKIYYCNNDNFDIGTSAGFANISGRIEIALSAVGNKTSAGDDN